jgi:hypothetical protein
MADIAGVHPAGRLVAVERQGVGADVLAPERALEAPAQFARLGLQRLGPLGHPEDARAFGGQAPRQVDVALHLDQRDRPLGQAAVGVEHGIEGVLPALV